MYESTKDEVVIGFIVAKGVIIYNYNLDIEELERLEQEHVDK